MYLLALGLAFLACKYFEYGPIATWEWWQVLSPFGVAVLWWWWADWSGYTSRQQEKKMEIRKEARINKNKEALGLPAGGKNSSKKSNRR